MYRNICFQARNSFSIDFLYVERSLATQYSTVSNNIYVPRLILRNTILYETKQSKLYLVQ